MTASVFHVTTRLEEVYSHGGRKKSGKEPKLPLNDGSFNASFPSFFHCSFLLLTFPASSLVVKGVSTFPPFFPLIFPFSSSKRTYNISIASLVCV